MPHFVIIGCGTAGTTAAAKLRQLDSQVELTIVTDEPTAYYFRPRLPEVIASKLEPTKITAYPPDWYTSKKINLRLNTKVLAINLAEKSLVTTGGFLAYDKLLLALGAKPRRPAWVDQAGDHVFTLRTITDALAIKKAAVNQKNIIIVGGGLLGLEMASNLADGQRNIHVIEKEVTLLANQLTPEKSAFLRQKLAATGLNFHLGQTVTTITDGPSLQQTRPAPHGHGQLQTCGPVTIHTSQGLAICGDIILVSAGVQARTFLATQTGLATEKGLLVNEYLQVLNQPDLYAAGDNIQFDGQTWGFVKSAFEQGQIAAENMLSGPHKPYTATKIVPAPKICGITLTN